ncbi:uncharacterized protein [Cicer arietinum]|uniref:uncharacterized protein n=1 Tax=Cicer arietinum TaxID=3827 RepID=UPI003CC6C3B0
MASQSETKSIFTNYITYPLSVEKLNESNYDSWAADIKLWLRGQGYEDHIAQNPKKVSVTETSKWSQIDAQLCIVIKSTLHPDVKLIFHPHLTCESVWSQANALYTNDTQRLYGVCHRLLNIITPNALHDFNELLPLAANNPVEQKKELDQCNTFFMLLALYGLLLEYSTTRDQTLGSVIISDMSTTSMILFRVPTKHPVEHSITPVSGDTAPLVSQGHNQHRSRGGPSNSNPHPKCEDCHQLGHTIDRCWKLHGKPSPSINATQLDPSATIQTTPSPQGSSTNYEDFLRWVQSHPNSSSPTSVAHTGNSSVYLSHSSSLGPWVLDSGASDHVTGNKCLFSSLSTSSFLPTITSANGTQTWSQGVGTVHIFSSISVASVLYDRNSGRTIGVRCESQDLYHLSTSSKTCSATKSPNTIQAQLGHLSLTKLQKLAPILSKLSTLHYSPPMPPLDPALPPGPDFPIALHKDIRTTRNPSPHYIDLCYHHLSPLHYTCLSSLSSVFIPKTTGEALPHPKWKQAMLDEMCALQSSAIQHWPLPQLDIKNAFLHGDLKEEVYMEQPPRFVTQGESSNIVCRLHRSLYGLKQSHRAWFDRFSSVVQEFGMIRSEADHSNLERENRRKPPEDTTKGNHQMTQSWSLLDIYAKNGDMDSAEKAFVSFVQHNVVSWNITISENGNICNSEKAVEFFESM